MNHISINTPCHENWSAMTPSEKGAFCGKCQTDVIDFSGKTPEQVKLILEQNAGKQLCGRFEKTQLSNLNASYADWENQTAKTFQSKFLYACLLVFGMTLFSCNAPEEMILGEISTPYYQPDTSATNTSQNDEFEDAAETIAPDKNDDWKHVKGKMDYNYSEEIYIKGDVAYVPEALKDSVDASKEIADTSVTNTCRVNTEINSNPVELTEDALSPARIFTGKTYPNPTGSTFTLELDVYADGLYTVELFTSNGEKLSTLYSIDLVAGKTNQQINLSDYPAGTYLVKVSSANQTEIYRVLKVE